MTEEANTSLLKRALRLVGRVTITSAVIALAMGAVVIGQSILTDRAEAVPQPPAAELTPVLVKSVAYEASYTVKREFLGQIEPRSSVDVSFELTGQIIELNVSEGQNIKKGDVIARLDTALLEAEQDRLEALKSATQAQLDFAQSRVERAKNLQERGFTSVESRDQAMALRDELTNRIAETEAALRSVQINLSKSTIYAPVSGQIGAQLSDTAETVSAGQTIAVILETGLPEFRVGIPLTLNTDRLASATVRVGSVSVPADLIQLRPDVDPVTRTRTALFSLPQDGSFVFGQTASLVLEIVTEAEGFWVDLDGLKQGDGSVWTVLTVDEDNTVRRAAVEVIYAEQDRAYVIGSVKNGDKLVAGGAHRIVPGQTVRPQQTKG